MIVQYPQTSFHFLDDFRVQFYLTVGRITTPVQYNPSKSYVFENAVYTLFFGKPSNENHRHVICRSLKSDLKLKMWVQQWSSYQNLFKTSTPGWKLWCFKGTTVCLMVSVKLNMFLVLFNFHLLFIYWSILFLKIQPSTS